MRVYSVKKKTKKTKLLHVSSGNRKKFLKKRRKQTTNEYAYNDNNEQ